METYKVFTPSGTITREAAFEIAKKNRSGAQYVLTLLRGREYIFDTGGNSPRFKVQAARRYA